MKTRNSSGMKWRKCEKCGKRIYPKRDHECEGVSDWNKSKKQIIADLDASINQKEFIETLRFYMRCNRHWKGWQIKEGEAQ